MTNLEMRQLAASLDLRAIRKACGFSTIRIAKALGTEPHIVSQYERGQHIPRGQLGNRYLRIVQAMRNHAEIPETGTFEHLAGEGQADD